MNICSKITALTAVACAMMAFSSSALALDIGDPAPELGATEWLQGEPVTSFEEGTIYVIECWATWCGPCISAIPHVAKLQEAYADNVVVIGMNVWERDPENARNFLESNPAAEAMTYRVALDGEGHVADNWLEAMGVSGIPAAFLIDGTGTLVWQGHPMELDLFLEAVVNGEDLDELRTEIAIIEALESLVIDTYQNDGAEAALAVLLEEAEGHEELLAKLDRLHIYLLAETGNVEALATMVSAAIEADTLGGNDGAILYLQVLTGVEALVEQEGAAPLLELLLAQVSLETLEWRELFVIARANSRAGLAEAAVVVQEQAIAALTAYAAESEQLESPGYLSFLEEVNNELEAYKAAVPVEGEAEASDA